MEEVPITTFEKVQQASFDIFYDQAQYGFRYYTFDVVEAWRIGLKEFYAGKITRAIDVLGPVKDALSWFWDSILSPGLDTVKNLIISGLSTVITAGQSLIKSVVDGIKGVVDGISTTVSDIWDSLVAGVSGLGSSIASWFTSLSSALANTKDWLYTNFTQFMEGLWDNLTQGVTIVWEAITTIGTKIWEGVTGIAGAIGNAVADWAGKFNNIMGDLLDGLGHTIWSAFQSIFALGTDLVSWLKSFFYDSVKWDAKAELAKLIGAIESAIEAMRGIPHSPQHYEITGFKEWLEPWAKDMTFKFMTAR